MSWVGAGRSPWKVKFWTASLPVTSKVCPTIKSSIIWNVRSASNPSWAVQACLCQFSIQVENTCLCQCLKWSICETSTGYVVSCRSNIYCVVSRVKKKCVSNHLLFVLEQFPADNQGVWWTNMLNSSRWYMNKMTAEFIFPFPCFCSLPSSTTTARDDLF